MGLGQRSMTSRDVTTTRPLRFNCSRRNATAREAASVVPLAAQWQDHQPSPKALLSWTPRSTPSRRVRRSNLLSAKDRTCGASACSGLGIGSRVVLLELQSGSDLRARGGRQSDGCTIRARPACSFENRDERIKPRQIMKGLASARRPGRSDLKVDLC